MVSYLVMKNSLKRLLVKKSTYLLMVLIPIVLGLIGSVSVRIEDRQLRVGIVGSEEYTKAMERELQGLNGILYEMADKETIHTDRIMGKYHYVLEENEDKGVLQEIKSSVDIKRDVRISILSAEQRMASMLLTIYMIITTLYGMKYLQDKRNKTVERVIVSGGTRCSYLTGCFFSTSLVTGIQLAIVFLIWKVFDVNFSLSLGEMGRIFLYILVVANLYGILVTLISKSELMAGILGSSVAALLSILGGTFVPVSSMPRILQAVSILSPMRWLM